MVGPGERRPNPRASRPDVRGPLRERTSAPSVPCTPARRGVGRYARRPSNPAIRHLLWMNVRQPHPRRSRSASYCSRGDTRRPASGTPLGVTRAIGQRSNFDGIKGGASPAIGLKGDTFPVGRPGRIFVSTRPVRLRTRSCSRRTWRQRSGSRRHPAPRSLGRWQHLAAGRQAAARRLGTRAAGVARSCDAREGVGGRAMGCVVR
jgi:hypothetical protein